MVLEPGSSDLVGGAVLETGASTPAVGDRQTISPAGRTGRNQNGGN